MTREEIIKRLEQGARLRKARKSAGYRSARSAALDNRWPESTYRAHEGGTRTIGQDDAERYAKRLRFRGASVTAEHILFGSEGAPDSSPLSSGPEPAPSSGRDVLLEAPPIKEAIVVAIEETYEAMNKSPTEAELDDLVRATLEVLQARRVLSRRRHRTVVGTAPGPQEREVIWHLSGHAQKGSVRSVPLDTLDANLKEAIWQLKSRHFDLDMGTLDLIFDACAVIAKPGDSEAISEMLDRVLAHQDTPDELPQAREAAYPAIQEEKLSGKKNA